MHKESEFVRNISCDACGSRDRAAVYSDGHTHCHKCGHRTNTGGTTTHHDQPRRLADTIQSTPTALTRRHLSEETCRLWGYGVGEYMGETVQVANYRGPDGALLGQKVRTADKDFRWLGKNASTSLFGINLWRDFGKMVVITEGEIDAMSVSQVQQHKWPVVSIGTGADGAAKAIAANVEWLEKFEKVVFMFDMDVPGQSAAKECAEMLSPGKAFIASLRDAKDANDLLKAGRVKDIIDAIWGAKEYRPDGVICGADLWERVSNPNMADSIPFPWEGVNKLTDGCRVGEVTTVVAGTGVGKTEFTRAIVAHFHDTRPDENVGIIALEETVERTAHGLMGFHLGVRLHLDLAGVDRAKQEAAFRATAGSGRYFLYDHCGSMELDPLLSRIRFMARGLGCRTVLLDNLTIVASGLEDQDERKALDIAMTKFKSLAQELGIRFVIVHHLKRLKEGAHEEGAATSMSHIRGTGGIGNYSNTVIGLERNQQGKDPNITKVRILKCRHTGKTGVATHLKYDDNTGRFSECGADIDWGDSEGGSKEDISKDF